MRMNGRHNSREATPDKNVASPTPVIVSIGTRLAESVIKGSDNLIRSPMLYRSTVISPNPERILYSTIKHPTVIFNTAARFATNISLQEQPVDFSSQTNRDRRAFGPTNEKSYALGLAIAV